MVEIEFFGSDGLCRSALASSLKSWTVTIEEIERWCGVDVVCRRRG